MCTKELSKIHLTNVFGFVFLILDIIAIGLWLYTFSPAFQEYAFIHDVLGVIAIVLMVISNILFFK